jgi:regulator of replication initiation timing
MSNNSGKTSRKRGIDEEEEDTSTLSSSRVEALEEEIERVTMENTELILENEKLRKLWETEKKEKEQFRKRIMEKALQTVTMERETYAKVKRYAQEKLFRVIKFITSENDLKDLQNPNSIASTTMKDLGIKEEDRIAWWSVYKVAITDGIADRRNQINTNMKTWVVRKSNPEIVMKVMMYTNKNITTPQEEMLSTPNFTVNNKRCLYTWTYRSSPRSSRCVKSQE